MNWSRNQSLLTLLLVGVCIVLASFLFRTRDSQQVVLQSPLNIPSSTTVLPSENFTTFAEQQIETHEITEIGNEQSEDEIYQLIQSNPQLAAELIGNPQQPSKTALTLSLIKNWSLTDPEAAFSWYQTQKHQMSESEYKIGMRALLLRYARHSPQAVFYELKEYISPDHQLELMFAVADGWASEDPQQAMVWLRELAALGEMPQKALDDAYAVVMTHYINHDPENAYTALTESEGTFNSVKLIPEFAVMQAEQDLAATTNWLVSTHPAHVQNASFVAMANARVERDPEGAFTLLTAVTEPPVHNEQSFSEAITRVVKYADDWVWNNFEKIPPHLHYSASAALAERALRGKLSLEQYQLWLQNTPSIQARKGGEEVLANHQDIESEDGP